MAFTLYLVFTSHHVCW